MQFSSSVSGVRYQFISALLQNAGFLYSNPIYLAYFIFFFPYLFRFLSFLSPLLLSISLVVFCIFTLEDLPAFDASPVKSEDEDTEAPFSDFFEYLQTPDHHNQPPNSCEHLEEYASPLIDAENRWPIWVSKEIDPASLEKQNSSNSIACKDTAAGHGGEAKTNPEIDKMTDQEIDKMSQISEVCNGDEEQCWSMRREKEWKRTLACKLYEERRSWEGGEGMDVLWEIHEADSAKAPVNVAKSGKAKSENKTKSSSQRFSLLARKHHKEDEHEGKDDGEVEEEEEEEDTKGPVCCLQALRLSTGKMNMGIRSSNLRKLSKALKGMRHLMRGEKRESC